MISNIFSPCLPYDGNFIYWIRSLSFLDMAAVPLWDMIQGLCSRFHMALLAYGHPLFFMDFLIYASTFMSASTTNFSYFRSFYNYLSTKIFSAKSTVSCLPIHVKLFFSICSELLIAMSNVFEKQVQGIYPK